MSKVKVSAGICGFTALIKAKKRKDGKIALKITSNCNEVKELADALRTVELKEAFRKICENPIYKAATQHHLHPACPVPSAILKAIEVEAGLAIPKDVSIEIEK